MQSTLEQFNEKPPSWALACPMSDSAMDRFECLLFLPENSHGFLFIECLC